MAWPPSGRSWSTPRECGGGLRAVVGTEITAAWGRHLLALFFEEPFPTQPFPRFRSLARTVAMVHDAGGLVAVPHPLRCLVPSMGARALDALLDGRGRGGAPEAFEVCSGILGGRRQEARLRRLNDAKWGLAPLGNSDAHHLALVGAAFTRFPGRTPADLRQAILARTTEACWGPPAAVPLAQHVRQGWRSLAVKPARELRAALRTPGRHLPNGHPR
jgi:hypothetical protein